MLKQIIAVAFLSSFALAQNNPFDRESEPGPYPKEICFTKCNETCGTCKEPYRCGDSGEDEIKCGDKPKVSVCTPDEECVKRSCECKCIIVLNYIRYGFSGNTFVTKHVNICL